MLLRWRHLGVGGRLACCFSLVVLLCGGVSAVANLDVSEPIVRRSPATDQDNFAFAAVLHHVEVPVPGNFESFINSTKLLIGAPQGTYPGGLSLPPLNPLNFTGLVYVCPVNAPGDCTGLLTTETNVSSNDRRLFDGDSNVVAENKTGQLMGSFLASNGEYFMACAPRWVTDPPISRDLDSRRPVGRCFVSPRNLMGFQVIQPCNGTIEANPGSSLSSNSQCLGGFSGALLTPPNGRGTLAIGVIGDNLFNGNIYYYNVSTTPAGNLGMTSSLRSRGITNLYDGYSTTVGFITNTVFEDVITGVPRFDGTLLSGGVRIRSQVDYTVDSVLNVTGRQTGEYFGFSVAAADLNNDTFDELIVGAPFYSDVDHNLQETGRVYVYRNTGGDLNPDPIMLTGQALNLARFGTAIVGLEDVNGDGYEDIAIGSPYEINGDNSGAVYIYYGRSAEDGFISSSHDQVIFASDIVEAVPDLQSVRTFGYSLFSGIDVDANQVNDLLIGAYESKTAVLIRSLSVAYLNVSVTASPETVSIDTTGTDGSMFAVTVCASYSGRGLEGRPLDTSVKVSEIVSSNVRRLFANNQSEITSDFVFPNTSEVKCVSIPVFVKPVRQLIGQVDLLSRLQVEVTFPPIPRRIPSYVGGDPVDLIDYRTIPVLIVEGSNIASVLPSVNCSLDENMMEVCHPDLTVTLLNVTYLDELKNPIPEGEGIADVVQFINVHLLYNNIGMDPAFGSVLTFTLPEGLEHQRVEPSSLKINCRETPLFYICDLPNFIPPGTPGTEEGTRIVLVWRIRGDILGNEPDDFSNVSISLDVSSRHEETNRTNNNLINGPIKIEYSAISDLDITRVEFTIDPTTYRGVPFRQGNPAVDQIGQRVQLTVTAVNNGPSLSPDSTLDIFIPTNDVEGSYYLYLFNVDDSGSGVVTCFNESSFNPDRLAPATATRRRRMARMPRQEETTPAPQVDDSAAQIRNCSNARGRASCTKITCRVVNFPVQASTTIDVAAFLDERFFQSQRDPFVFVAYAEIRNNNDFVQDPNLNNNRGSSPPYRVVRMATASGSFPIWIPIVCGIVAVILIIALFVLLYFVGFFRRRKLEDNKQAEGDFNVEDTNGKPSNEKPAVTEAPVEPEADDIGDSEDLNDGNDAEKPDPKADVDPEETSL